MMQGPRRGWSIYIFIYAGRAAGIEHGRIDRHGHRYPTAASALPSIQSTTDARLSIPRENKAHLVLGLELLGERRRHNLPAQVRGRREVRLPALAPRGRHVRAVLHPSLPLWLVLCMGVVFMYTMSTQKWGGNDDGRGGRRRQAFDTAPCSRRSRPKRHRSHPTSPVQHPSLAVLMLPPSNACQGGSITTGQKRKAQREVGLAAFVAESRSSTNRRIGGLGLMRRDASEPRPAPE